MLLIEREKQRLRERVNCTHECHHLCIESTCEKACDSARSPNYTNMSKTVISTAGTWDLSRAPAARVTLTC
jgi:hypothetical protein